MLAAVVSRLRRRTISSDLSLSGVLVPSTLQTGQWYHVASTYENGTAQAFVDGFASTAASVGTLTQGPLLSMGGFEDYSFFGGTTDSVRISDIVRYTSDSEMSNEPFSADANTLGLWYFDEGTGQVALDASASANRGTLGATSGGDSAGPTWVSGYPFPGSLSTPANTSMLRVGGY
jgi:hypothetical protein